jgi:membrane-associated protease RseP (regulator of RpoE activity)
MRKQAILLSCAALLVLGSVSHGQDNQPFIGVLLDGTPLPELLTKHLGLEPGQGLRVMNISIGSTAERAGLERDDIIVAFQGQKAMDLDQFIETVKKAGVGAKVKLDVIHLGQRKAVELQLEPLGKMDWKYPSEPEAVTSWRPGNVFKVGPDGNHWVQIPIEEFSNLNIDFRKFFKETYTYKDTVDGQECIITIQGNPAEADTKVVVQAGGIDYSATVGEIDKLPEKYRDSVKQAVESAKKNFHITHSLQLPEPPRPEVYQKFFNALPQLDVERLSQEKDRMIERLQGEMERLQQRMQQLEEKLLDKKSNAEPKSEKDGPSASPQSQEKSSV